MNIGLICLNTHGHLGNSKQNTTIRNYPTIEWLEALNGVRNDINLIDLHKTSQPTFN